MKVGDKCWFTKSMRMVEIVEVHSNGHTVETIDTRKRLFATEKGLELIHVPDEAGFAANQRDMDEINYRLAAEEDVAAEKE